jgi:E3 ubiquitin-protein ligase CCNP1IP1
MQTQEMFDKMKRRSMLGQVQDAASDAVEHTFLASAAANRYVDRVGDQAHQRVPPPLFPSQQGPSKLNQDTSTTNIAPLTSGRETWGGFSSQGSNPCMQSGDAVIPRS